MGDNTAATLTVDLTTKEATLTGVIAVRETVDLTLVGGTVAHAAGYRLALISNEDDPTDDDVTPLAVCNTFAPSGSAILGELDLNTTELVAYFAGYSGRQMRCCYVAIWDVTRDNLVACDTIQIMNNPYRTGMEDPTPSDPIGGGPVDGVTNGDTHDHYGGDGAQIDHTTLSNIGILTHLQLEASLSAAHNLITAIRAGTASGTVTSLALKDTADGKFYSVTLVGGVLTVGSEVV